MSSTARAIRSTSAWIVIVVVVAGLAVIASGIEGVSNIRDARSDAEVTRTMFTRTHSQLGELRAAIANARRFEKDIVIRLGETAVQQNYLVLWAEQVSQAQVTVEEISALEGVDVDSVSGLLTEYIRSVGEILAELASDAPSVTAAVAANGLIEPHKPAIRALDESLIVLSERFLVFQDQSVQEASVASEANQRRILSYDALLVAMLGLGGLVAVRRSARAVAALVEAMETDDLTGLLTRTALLRHHRSVDASPQAVLMINLDSFTIVNDVHGHSFGDGVLVEIGTLIAAETPAGSAARLGGDSFVVILSGSTARKANAIAESLRATIASTEFSIGAERCVLRASVGVAATDGIEDMELERLICHSDAALYTAKSLGGDQVSLMEARITDGDVRATMILASRVSRIMEEDCLYLVFQELHSEAGNHRRCELLLRATDPDTGESLSPADLIGPAEQFGLTTQIDTWVLSTALEALSDGRLNDFDRVSVNVSGRSITNPAFRSEMARLLQADPETASRVCIELTETALVSDCSAVEDFISLVGRLGASFAIDDFGVGSTSLSMLESLEIDLIKIDGRFVRQMLNSPTSMAIVRAVTEIAATRGIEVAAEHVETHATDGRPAHPRDPLRPRLPPPRARSDPAKAPSRGRPLG